MTMSEPTFWGSWKGRVVKAIAVDHAQTWSDIQEVTGLSEYSLNTALSELYDAGVLKNVDDRYRVSYDLYQEYRVFFSSEQSEHRHIEDRPSTPIPSKLGIICPYCEEKQEITLGEQMPVEVVCTPRSINRSNCNLQWHSGIFKINVFEIGQHRRRGLGRGQPTIYHIRPYNQKQLIEFRSFNKSLIMRNGDLVVLMYRRTSKGWFTKEWTGEWETTPHIFQNASVNHHWILNQ
jgi:hypothetical protein